jgi:hypothetical protein
LDLFALSCSTYASKTTEAIHELPKRTSSAFRCTRAHNSLSGWHNGFVCSLSLLLHITVMLLDLLQ